MAIPAMRATGVSPVTSPCFDPNRTDLAVGDITAIAKKGWECMWVRYAEAVIKTSWRCIMNEREILARTREMIAEHASGDPDRWWYANRFVFARLMLDERKTKTNVKQKLLDANMLCPGCGKRFETRRDIHLHRLDGDKAYSQANCVLMHPDCHRAAHAAHPEAVEVATGREPTLTKWSKRYDDMPFVYWWDIAPGLAEQLNDLEPAEFAKKDTKDRCVVPVEMLRTFLTPERQTTRGQGNWGVKVLKDRPDELAFEPGTGSREWRFLPVVWLEEAED